MADWERIAYDVFLKSVACECKWKQKAEDRLMEVYNWGGQGLQCAIASRMTIIMWIMNMQIFVLYCITYVKEMNSVTVYINAGKINYKTHWIINPFWNSNYIIFLLKSYF